MDEPTRATKIAHAGITLRVKLEEASRRDIPIPVGIIHQMCAEYDDVCYPLRDKTI